MHAFHTPCSFLNDLSRLAKQQSKLSDHGHTYFLEQIARYSGFRPWGSLREAITRSGEQTRFGESTMN
ncbi:hypothetical protein DFO67_13024 [Modicisalibacter xianhensis]|uniref:Uncharacterized protein n=1 Tax=Modicisalibacter xianhensis TaxID=442341 RepID=A0A4R8F9A6_9GAMM|nr:hypothetical protein DFO67_13024 [Halomonas xianhensis]